ncbi:MAG: antitoxin [Candidatus Rokubacteria bacterium]|nr:antitoxin [Candidatus Rokubacteria bacterium]
MRTTLDIDDDVLRAAKELARREKKTAGAVISELSRRGLTASRSARPRAPKALHGFRPFPRRGGVVTNEGIDKLREDDAY